MVGCCERTMRDWARGKFYMTESAYHDLLKKSSLKSGQISVLKKKDNWHILTAARLGGLERQKIYGDLGTPEGRRRGGLRSAQVQKDLPNGFKKLKRIHIPKHSVELAEFMGIMQGDGHLGDYQVLMVTNSETDMDHACFVGCLGEKLFKVTPVIRPRKHEKAVRVLFSSKLMVEALHLFGMPIGNKIFHGLSIPPWILSSSEYKAAFIRGLFDTDGCVFLDKHLIKNRLYQHIGWAMTSVSPHFREQIVQVMRDLGFRPSYRPSQRSVFLRRQADVHHYFDQIGSSNRKHLERYRSFQKK